MAERKATSADVASRAGVSRTTVSFVLNNTPGKNIPDGTRRKVLEAARELGFVPNEKARDVAMIKHHSIGFFIPHAGYISSDAYIIRVIEGMTPVLNKNRFRLVLQPLKLQEMDYLSRARQDSVDGIILMNTHDEDKGLAELVAERFPLVVIGTVSHPGVLQIDINNRAAARSAVEYLISIGHREIGMILHAPDSYYAARDRYEGYREAMEAARCAVRRSWVRNADLTEESGYKAMTEILAEEKRPTAMFAGNDVVAYGAMQAIKDAGLAIPQDISIMGFDDDLPSRYVNPPLSTVTNPAPSLGAAAARLLIGVLQGRVALEPAPELPMLLAVRDSCRPA
jgi:DNA-binding LacI/PurR family transcriptional regulator